MCRVVVVGIGGYRVLGRRRTYRNGVIHLCYKRIEMNSFGTKDHLVESVCNTAKSTWVDDMLHHYDRENTIVCDTMIQ